MSNQRDRGRILTPEGQQKLRQAIREWEIRHERRCTQEKIKELTSAFKEGGLDPATISRILKARGVDLDSIRCLFKTFGLRLDEADWVSATPFKVEVDPNFVGREEAIALERKRFVGFPASTQSTQGDCIKFKCIAKATEAIKCSGQE